MTTKTEWDAALDAAIAADRERAGAPPTPDEVEAYLSGTLSPNDATRVRAALVHHPELTGVLRKAPVVTLPSRWLRAFNIAASIAIVVAAGFWIDARRDVRALKEQLRQPHVFATRHELEVLRPRGAQQPPRVFELPAREERYLLVPRFRGEDEFTEFRLEIVQLSAPAETVWRAERVRRAFGEPLEVVVSREFLRSGEYRLDVYGLAGRDARLLESFPIRIGAR